MPQNLLRLCGSFLESQIQEELQAWYGQQTSSLRHASQWWKKSSDADQEKQSNKIRLKALEEEGWWWIESFGTSRRRPTSRCRCQTTRAGREEGLKSLKMKGKKVMFNYEIKPMIKFWTISFNKDGNT